MSENSLGFFPAGLKTCPSVFSQHLRTDFFPVLFFGFCTKMKREAGLIHESQTCFFQPTAHSVYFDLLSNIYSIPTWNLIAILPVTIQLTLLLLQTIFELLAYSTVAKIYSTKIRVVRPLAVGSVKKRGVK